MARRTARTFVAAGALTALCAAVLALPAPAGAAPSAQAPANPNTDGRNASPDTDTTSALVILRGAPLATAPGTRNAKGRVDSNRPETRNARAALAAQRNDFTQWVRANAPRAQVTGEFDLALQAVGVELNGTPLSVLRNYSGTVDAQYETRYTPTSTAGDPDLPLVKGFAAWAAVGGSAGAGRGVKVAVIDSGIDVRHPCFSDGTTVPPGKLTNAKVIVAKVFYNKAANQGLTAAAVDSHGTHVAGTIACNADTPAVVDGVAIPYGISGVAPAALLGNYNVFPGSVGNARSQDIVDALEQAYADGFDVANMSLGGDTHGARDLLANAVDNLTAADMVIAVSAGNSGPGDATIGSPGSAAGAITSGASTVPHFVGSTLTVGGIGYPAAKGDFGSLTADLTRPLKVVRTDAGSLSQACSALPANALSGAIGVVSRGTCSFSTKIRTAQAAGAAAVIVVNNVAGDPTVMGSDGTAGQPTVAGFMVGLSDRAALLALPAAQNATLASALSYQLTANANILAGFSSIGPVDVTYRVKPDLVAPGVNVLSSFPAQYCDAPPCFAFLSGTSMSSPHVAGAAAVVRGARPSLTAAQVKGVLTAVARRDVVTTSADGTSIERRVQAQGNGLMDVAAALTAPVVLGPVSTSFGAIPGGSGQTRTATVQVTNVSDAPVTLTASVAAPSGLGASFAAGAQTLTLAPGASGSLPVTVTIAKGAAAGTKQAFLVLSFGDQEVAHGALFALVT